MQTIAAIATGAGKPFELRTVTLEGPRNDEILVRIAAVGLCHTDLVFRDQMPGFPFPAVFGHEGAGIVEMVGSEVTKVAPGDHVLITFRSCGKCSRCADRQSAYCHQMPAMNFTGARTDGTMAISFGGQTVASNFFGQSSFAHHALAYERNVVKLSNSLSLSTYAPLGCGVQTGAGAIMRSLTCPPGSSVAIIGAGTVGLSAVMAAVVQKCDVIVAIEPVAARRVLAMQLGATHVIDPAAVDTTAAVRGIIPMGVDNALDCSGYVPAISAALAYLAPRGTLGLVGAPRDLEAHLSIPITRAISCGLGIRGIIEGDSEPDTFIPQLIELHQQGQFPFDRLIKKYAFDNINGAVADQHEGKVVKVVLEI